MQVTTSQTMSFVETQTGTEGQGRTAHDDPVVDIAIPVYNEERVLASSVRRLRRYLDENLPWPAIVTIVDNASTDSTPDVAEVLAGELPGVRAMRIDVRGRGRALRAAWEQSHATVVAYMDVDLSTSLDALLPLLAPLVSGHSDVAIGSRLAHGARVVRGPKREVISRGYNLLLHALLGSGFSDAQCGFKAMRAEVARVLLPAGDNSWFFDTELLVLAEERAMRVHEVAVDWVDDPDSRVDIVRTARDDLLGVLRLLRRRFTANPRGRLRSTSCRYSIGFGALYPGRPAEHGRLPFVVLGPAPDLGCGHRGPAGAGSVHRRPGRRPPVGDGRPTGAGRAVPPVWSGPTPRVPSPPC